MRRRNVIISLAIVTMAAFVFFVPIVPANINVCPPNAFCPFGSTNFPATVSVSYYAVGVGGRVLLGTTYQIVYWPWWVCTSTSTPTESECHQIMSSLS
jgi:hypothetical protein